MTINGEECERVTSFDSLRAGMIVWRLPCLWCGGKHRGILGRKIVKARLRPTLERTIEPGWSFLPSTDHALNGSSISLSSIADGNVFRVVDPLLDAQTTERQRELARG